MIRLREITGKENLLRAFVAHYMCVGGFPLDLAYALRCRAFAFMDANGQMMGGFLLNLAPPFRSLNDMPEAERQRILAMLDLDQTFEAMCFWIAPEVRGTFLMMRFWAELLFFLWRFPRRDMLGCTVWKSLLRQYSVVPIRVLYEGQIPTQGRMLDKYVFLCQGKKGFASGLLREAMRRGKKLLSKRFSPKELRPSRASSRVDSLFSQQH